MLCCQYCGRALPNNSAVCECRMKPALDDGGPAFPCGVVDVAANKVESPAHDGMSLRDYFAGQALANFELRGETPARASEWAYAIATAMLAERAKRGK